MHQCILVFRVYLCIIPLRLTYLCLWSCTRGCLLNFAVDTSINLWYQAPCCSRYMEVGLEMDRLSSYFFLSHKTRECFIKTEWGAGNYYGWKVGQWNMYRKILFNDNRQQNYDSFRGFLIAGFSLKKKTVPQEKRWKILETNELSLML